MSWCETCAIGEKLEVSILGGQRIDKKRKKGWWRGRRERIEKGITERIEIERQKGTERGGEGTSTLAFACCLKALRFSNRAAWLRVA